MRINRRLALVAIGGLTATAWSQVAAAAPPIGVAAPAVRLRDLDNRWVDLGDYAGRPVVLEWTNPECPYVAKHYDGGAMQALQQQARQEGAIWLTISSAAPGQVGYVDALEAAAWLDARRATPTHYLLDRDGALAVAYGVDIALTMAVVDQAGRLAYYGAIDDRPTARPSDVSGARNYVRAALTAVQAGQTPQPARTRPYGCKAR